MDFIKLKQLLISKKNYEERIQIENTLNEFSMLDESLKKILLCVLNDKNIVTITKQKHNYLDVIIKDENSTNKLIVRATTKKNIYKKYSKILSHSKDSNIKKYIDILNNAQKGENTSNEDYVQIVLSNWIKLAPIFTNNFSASMSLSLIQYMLIADKYDIFVITSKTGNYITLLNNGAVCTMQEK